MLNSWQQIISGINGERIFEIKLSRLESLTTTQTDKNISLKDRSLSLADPRVMGIINLTADSFYDGGKIKSDLDLLNKVERMTREGVDILDIGAYSSRPGAKDIPLEDERKSAATGIESILKNFPNAILSIDTFRSQVAKEALDHGATIINDISGGSLDGAMFDLVAESKAPYIMMHMRGNPQTMTGLTDYSDMVSQIIDYFKDKINDLRNRGVKDIIIDPGFGFAKTKEQNFRLLGQMESLQAIEVPILCGVSRKSMIFKELGVTPDDALNGTTALNMVCLMKGASILRVHDVKEAKETIQLFKAMTKGKI